MRARARALCTKSLDLTWGAQLATRDSPSRLPRPGAHRCTHQVVHYTIFANYRLPNPVCSSKHLVTPFLQFTSCPPKHRTRINQREFGRRFSFVLRLTFLWCTAVNCARRRHVPGLGYHPSLRGGETEGPCRSAPLVRVQDIRTCPGQTRWPSFAALTPPTLSLSGQVSKSTLEQVRPSDPTARQPPLNARVARSPLGELRA